MLSPRTAGRDPEEQRERQSAHALRKVVLVTPFPTPDIYM
jgi:hypothetical protein